MFCYLCFVEPDPVFDSYLQGPAPLTVNVEQTANSNKEVALTSSSGSSQGNFSTLLFV